jgi:DNA polymerase-1
MTTAEPSPPDALLAGLRRVGVARGALVGLAVAPGIGVAVSVGGRDEPVSVGTDDPPALIRAAEAALRPRWVLWSSATAEGFVRAGVRIARCWDISAVHRVLVGGWQSDPARVWAALHDLPPGTIPLAGPADLFGDGGGEPDDPVRPDGHLRPEWVAGGWADTPARLGRWAELAWTAAGLQQARLGELAAGPGPGLTAHAESAAELLGVEMSVDGLPMDRTTAEQLIAGFIGPRPRSAAEAAARRAERDRAVLRHVPAGVSVDLRSPGQVKGLLARVGIDVVDTRAWRLRALRDPHPLVEALLEWRTAERIATTFGYGWLDEHLGGDGRLRGRWTGSDGAAGRMTASGGLHNMPAAMRPAVVAASGYVFVRSDLGQIEPRVLAAVSGDATLARAAAADDMYAPVATELGVDRATAKVAVLGAMYGQTTGLGAQALRRLDDAYPVAMAYLQRAARAAEAGDGLRTYGGRAIPFAPPPGSSGRETPGRAAARGRYGRNALIQGAAAELFKVWAVTVRARCEPLGARIVLCLHDELLVHAPARQAVAVAGLLDDCLEEATRRWAPDGAVRFVADVSVIRRWSEAKGSGDPPA